MVVGKARVIEAQRIAATISLFVNLLKSIPAKPENKHACDGVEYMVTGKVTLVIDASAAALAATIRLSLSTQPTIVMITSLYCLGRKVNR